MVADHKALQVLESGFERDKVGWRPVIIKGSEMVTCELGWAFHLDMVFSQRVLARGHEIKVWVMDPSIFGQCGQGKEESGNHLSRRSLKASLR